ncbi:MAG: hypothetical protein JWP99_646 [Devosia sp.]|nr:hypothetical protein [Devosia sp.]
MAGCGAEALKAGQPPKKSDPGRVHEPGSSMGVLEVTGANLYFLNDR